MSKRLFNRVAVIGYVGACVGIGASCAPANAASIGLHWATYQGGGGPDAVTGTDGVVPQGDWNEADTNYYGPDAGNTNLIDSTGATTGVSAFSYIGPATVGTPGTGTPYYHYFNTSPAEPLLVGPGGGNGPIPTHITGITYSTYNIIFYVNNFFSGNASAWLDTVPAAPGPTVANQGTVYYFGTTGQPSAAGSFVQITNTTSGTFPLGNYVEFTGLSGATQTMWMNDAAANFGPTAFQIVDTTVVPEPATLSIVGMSALMLVRRRRTKLNVQH